MFDKCCFVYGFGIDYFVIVGVWFVELWKVGIVFLGEMFGIDDGVVYGGVVVVYVFG